MSNDPNLAKDAAIDDYVYDQRVEVSFPVRREGELLVLRLEVHDPAEQLYNTVPLKFRTRRGLEAFLQKLECRSIGTRMDLDRILNPLPSYTPFPPNPGPPPAYVPQ